MTRIATLGEDFDLAGLIVAVRHAVAEDDRGECQACGASPEDCDEGAWGSCVLAPLRKTLRAWDDAPNRVVATPSEREGEAK
jgi:hypothetical protein